MFFKLNMHSRYGCLNLFEGQLIFARAALYLDFSNDFAPLTVRIRDASALVEILVVRFATQSESSFLLFSRFGN